MLPAAPYLTGIRAGEFLCKGACRAFLLLGATPLQPLLGLTSEGLPRPEAKEGSGSLWGSESPGGGWLTPAAQISKTLQLTQGHLCSPV